MDSRFLKKIVEKYWKGGYEIQFRKDKSDYKVVVTILFNPDEYESFDKSERSNIYKSIMDSLQRNYDVRDGGGGRSDMYIVTPDMWSERLRPIKSRGRLKKILREKAEREQQMKEEKLRQKEIEKSLFPEYRNFYRKENPKSVTYFTGERYKIRFDKSKQIWKAEYNSGFLVGNKPYWSPMGKGTFKTKKDVARVLDKVYDIEQSGKLDEHSRPRKNLVSTNLASELLKVAKELVSSQIAKTIAEQMGGPGRINAMIGGQLMAINKGLGIKFPSRKRSKGNYVEITLRSDDTYDMEFFNVSVAGRKPVKKYRSIYNDQLVPIFEKQTGLYLRI